jgi:asparagine synthase (glutamine-hydrolysing)
MCGLTGILAFDRRPEADLHHIVSSMTKRMRHRGPDAEGIWTSNGIALGHRRLSILDISPAGAQPMQSACSRYVIVFNGEIYNHLEFRRDLEKRGTAPNWRGRSDTETLLAGIAFWGLDATLRRAAGMFAIALWDRKESRLSLARDRIGEKPLYWGWVGGSLVFGSELKALAAHPGFAGGICREALAQFLRFAYVPAPRSIYPGIYKLEPGTILDIAGRPPGTAPAGPLRPGQSYGSLSIRRYWSLNATIEKGMQDPIRDDGEAVEELERVLSSAVQRQMISDVPLGAFLSGGVDSSTIVALMQRHSTRPVKTFTIGFSEAAFDESGYAAAVARYLRTDHTALRVTAAEARAVIPDLPNFYDEPFADSSQIPTHLVCRLARAQVTVALSGDAGDELFGGYSRYFWGPRIWQRLAWMPLPVRRILGRLIAEVPVATWDRLGALAGGVLAVSRPGDKAHKLAARLREVQGLDDLYLSLISEWPGHRIVKHLDREPASVLDDPLPVVLNDDPIGRMMVQDMRSYLPDDILCKVDRAAMGVSLETRVPFLDPDVIALSARLPRGVKIRYGEGKWAVRQVLYRHVPRGLIDRPKSGFGIPVGEWLRGPLRNWAEDLLSPGALARDGLIDPAPVTKVWTEHVAGQRDWAYRLWIILMLQAWRAKWTKA